MEYQELLIKNTVEEKFFNWLGYTHPNFFEILLEQFLKSQK